MPDSCRSTCSENTNIEDWTWIMNSRAQRRNKERPKILMIFFFFSLFCAQQCLTVFINLNNQQDIVFQPGPSANSSRAHQLFDHCRSAICIRIKFYLHCAAASMCMEPCKAANSSLGESKTLAVHLCSFLGTSLEKETPLQLHGGGESYTNALQKFTEI